MMAVGRQMFDRSLLGRLVLQLGRTFLYIFFHYFIFTFPMVMFIFSFEKKRNKNSCRFNSSSRGWLPAIPLKRRAKLFRILLCKKLYKPIVNYHTAFEVLVDDSPNNFKKRKMLIRIF